MKTCFSFKTLIALAVVTAAAVNCQMQADEASVSTSENSAALPAGIPLGSPVGQVFKLAQAGVDPGVIQTYISNSPSAFDLRADDIIALTDAGVTTAPTSAKYWHVAEAVEALGGATAAEASSWLQTHYPNEPIGDIRAVNPDLTDQAHGALTVGVRVDDPQCG